MKGNYFHKLGSRLGRRPSPEPQAVMRLHDGWNDCASYLMEWPIIRTSIFKYKEYEPENQPFPVMMIMDKYNVQRRIHPFEKNAAAPMVKEMV